MFCLLVCSPGGAVQSSASKGTSAGLELDSAQSDRSRWQVCPGGQRQHLVVSTGDHSQVAAAA